MTYKGVFTVILKEVVYMKKLNMVDMIVDSLILIIAVVIQGVIFFAHPVEWYRNFYYALSAVSIGLLACAVYYIFAILRNRRILNSCVLLPCIGMIISVFQYKNAITHIDPSKPIYGLNYFVLTPFIICVLISMVIYLFSGTKISRKTEI